MIRGRAPGYREYAVFLPLYNAILGRRLDIPVVNLGFSGNGRMDRAVGEFLVQVDASAYVIGNSR
jgi:hypothetical protein